jgi:type I restriction enzyme, R subunit
MSVASMKKGSGPQPALGYAEILEIPSAFSSNGDAFASHNKVPSAGEDIETQFAMGAFPGPTNSGNVTTPIEA